MSETDAGHAGPEEVMPLAGVRVVALEQAVAAPLATRHLADLGADVVKIERPGEGDFARHYDGVVLGQSAYFVWLNRGKRSVALDLGMAADRSALDALLGRSDVFVHNLGPGAAERLGLDHARIERRWPRLIGCAISGYGPDGPYARRKGFDLLLQGESGLMSVTGTGDAPAKVGISIADIAAGMYALTSILAALRRRELTGKGSAIEISLLDCLAEWMSVPTYQARYGDGPPPRCGMRHAAIVPYGPYRTADGQVNLAVQNAGQWRRLCEQVLGRPELADEPDFATNAARVANRERLEREIEGILGSFSRLEAERRLLVADVPFGEINDVADLLAHPQLLERGRWWDVPTAAGAVRTIMPPFNILGLPERPLPVPELGEHTEAVLEELS